MAILLKEDLAMEAGDLSEEVIDDAREFFHETIDSLLDDSGRHAIALLGKLRELLHQLPGLQQQMSDVLEQFHHHHSFAHGFNEMIEGVADDVKVECDGVA